jgi:hypothetical protein
MDNKKVSRLGDFSPLGRLFTLGSFMEKTQLAQMCVLIISDIKVRINFDEKRVALHFGLLGTHFPLNLSYPL